MHSHHASNVVEAHLVSLERGHYWVGQELLGPGGAVADLREALPGVLPDPDGAVIERLTVRADGQPVADDVLESDARLYRNAIWEAARACVDRARDRPVIFLLAGGRQRTMTAYATTVYQLLARKQDQLMDVRVSDRRAEGGSGFFFPMQRQRQLVTDGGVLDAQTVEVYMVPVEVPRLAGLLEPEHLVSFEVALEASRQAIEAMTPPHLFVDLDQGKAFVNGEHLPLSAAQLTWYGLLALVRVRDAAEGSGEVASDPVPLLETLLRGISAKDWSEKINEATLRTALGLGPKVVAVSVDSNAEQLKKLRADTKRAVAKWLNRKVRPAWAKLLLPESGKRNATGFQRLPLDFRHIEVRLPGA